MKLSRKTIQNLTLKLSEYNYWIEYLSGKKKENHKTIQLYGFPVTHSQKNRRSIAGEEYLINVIKPHQLRKKSNLDELDEKKEEALSLKELFRGYQTLR